MSVLRYFLLVVVFCMTVFAGEVKQKVTIGLGAYFQSQPYKDVDDIVMPSPVIFFDNGIVYARWSRFGIYFYGDKAESKNDLSWGFSFTAQPRVNGYKPDDSSYLIGLDEKKTSMEGGLAFTVQKNGKYLEIMCLGDLFNRYDSYIVKAETGFEYKFKKLSIYPSLIGVYESKKFTDYYYGISNNEASRTSYLPYNPSGGLRVAVQTYLSYPIYKNYSAFFNFRVDRLTNEAKDSPIVDESVVYSGLASIIYTFSY